MVVGVWEMGLDGFAAHALMMIPLRRPLLEDFLL